MLGNLWDASVSQAEVSNPAAVPSAGDVCRSVVCKSVCAVFVAAEHALKRQPGQNKSGHPRRSSSAFFRMSTDIDADKLGVNNSDSHIACKLTDSAHPCHRVSQIKARTDVRERQHGGILNHRAAITSACRSIELHRVINRAGADTRQRAHKCGRQNTRTFSIMAPGAVHTPGLISFLPDTYASAG